MAEHTGVAFLNKLKIHELAKELNVTSKRLMEKLEEINIHPRSHMSTLNDDELERLYKHIGIVNRTPKKDASESKKDSRKTDRSESVAKRGVPVLSGKPKSWFMMIILWLNIRKRRRRGAAMSAHLIPMTD